MRGIDEVRRRPGRRGSASRAFRGIIGAAWGAIILLASAPGFAQPRVPASAETVRLEALTLAEALVLASARNREVLAARRGVDAARAGVMVAGARPNPNLTVGVGAINPSAGIGGGTVRDKTVDTYVRIDQVIERGGKRELRIDSAQSLAAAAGADLGMVLRQQRFAAAAAYYDLLEAQDRVQVTGENAELFARTLAAAGERLKAGDIAQADLTRLRVDALRAQNEVEQALADRVRARIALALVTGVEQSAERIVAVDAWPALRDPTALDLAAAIDARAETRAAIARAEAAGRARELARRLRTRDVTVGAQYDHYPATPANNLGSGNSYGFSVSLPLFWRYGFEGEIQRAEVEYFAAQDALERVRSIARSDIDRARADLRATAERNRRYESNLLPEAGRSAEFAEFAYRNGAIGVMDLLDARRVLRATQLEALQARADYAKALAQWQAATAPFDPAGAE